MLVVHVYIPSFIRYVHINLCDMSVKLCVAGGGTMVVTCLEVLSKEGLHGRVFISDSGASSAHP